MGTPPRRGQGGIQFFLGSLAAHGVGTRIESGTKHLPVGIASAANPTPPANPKVDFI